MREGCVRDVVNIPVLTAAELATKQKEIVDAMSLSAIFLAVEYDDGVQEVVPAGGEFGDEARPAFAGIASETAAAVPENEPVVSATGAAAADKLPPLIRRKVGECSVCIAATHRVRKSGEPCHTAYLEQKRKKAAA